MAGPKNERCGRATAAGGTGAHADAPGADARSSVSGAPLAAPAFADPSGVARLRIAVHAGRSHRARDARSGRVAFDRLHRWPMAIATWPVPPPQYPYAQAPRLDTACAGGRPPS